MAVGGDPHGPILVNSPLQFTVVHQPAPAAATVARPKTLPPDVADFTGRTADVERIESTARANLGLGATATAVISGKPGIGKTALAVRAAHRLAEIFPDGVLYADLRGVDAEPAPPAEIAGRFLHVLGVPDDEIPADPYLRLDLYRQRSARLALLLVLDNAADEKQVRPLLPSGAGTAALVTSRNKLAGLEGAHRFDLETFPTRTSLDFLERVTARTFRGKDAQAALAVAAHCGHLPLALRIAAHRMQSHPALRISDLASELQDEHDRLAALTVGDLAVRKAFNLSYRKLGKGCKNAFRKLSHVPGPDFGPGICGALTGAGESSSAKTLRKLAEANLIEPSAVPGRYRFHDLVKQFAREKVRKDPAAEPAADQRRMILWLQHSALRAQFQLAGVFEVVVPSDSGAAIHSMEAATTWVEEELANAVAALPVSESLGQPKDTATLALSLCGVCETVGRWDEWAAVCESGLRAATGTDIPGLSMVFLTNKANIARCHRDFSTALTYATQVYEEARTAEEPLLIAGASNLLGCVLVDTGRLDEGLPLLQESLGIYERYDIKHEVAKVLYNFGTIHRAAGELEQAIAYFKRDLEVCTATSDEAGAAETLNTLALTYAEMGKPAEAEELQRRALDVFTRIGNPHKVSMVLNDLAITVRRRERYEEALELHEQDVEVCRRVGNVSGEALAHGNAAEVLRLLGRNRDAADRAALAQLRFAELGDEQRLAETVIAHLPALFEDGRVPEAAAQARQAIEILARFGEAKKIAAAHQLLAREYGKREWWEESLAHAEESLLDGGKVLSPYARAPSYVFAIRAGLRLGRGDGMDHYRALLRSICAQRPDIRIPRAEELGL